MDYEKPVIDFDELRSWRADWAGLRVAALGLGVTGFAVADTLAELGCRVLVVCENADETRAAILEVLAVAVHVQGETKQPPPVLIDFDPQLVVVSPGYRHDHPLLVWADESGLPVWGDIELAWRLRDKVEPAAQWLLVTGTNGKTTTTMMAAHLLRGAGFRAIEAGNFGTPVLDVIRDPAGFDFLVVELSSFQLHRMPITGPGAVHPLASVCLNVAEDHLDWHGSMREYIAAKARVYFNTASACIYNRADSLTVEMVEQADVQEGCRAIGFGLDSPGLSEIGIVDGIVVDRAFIAERANTALELTTVGELAAAGLTAAHTVSNALAAVALARAAGADAAAVHDALMTFAMGEHRSQLVLVAHGISWVDDSKATNPHAAAAALRSFDSVVWILGGLLKGVDIGPLIAAHAGRLRAAVVIGVARNEVLDAFTRHAPQVAVVEVNPDHDGDVMNAAVRMAASFAQAGDVVLLSPSAASMDQFVDYADRGKKFQAAVRAHTAGGGYGDDDRQRSEG